MTLFSRQNSQQQQLQTKEFQHPIFSYILVAGGATSMTVSLRNENEEICLSEEFDVKSSVDLTLDTASLIAGKYELDFTSGTKVYYHTYIHIDKSESLLLKLDFVL